jgi:hypothetical protein
MSLHTDFQIPQFLLDDWLLNWDSGSTRHVEIICTQPRRLSAIGVAERVAEERAEEIGNTVGYQVMHLILHKTTAVNLNSPDCSLCIQRLPFCIQPDLCCICFILWLWTVAGD